MTSATGSSDYSDVEYDSEQGYDTERDEHDTADGHEATFGEEEEDFNVNVKGKGKARAAASSLPPPSHEDGRAHSKFGQAGRQEHSRAWSDLNLSIIVALISPIGHWLTGSDHVKHLCLLLLLIYYLHQLIEGMQHA